jgi:hypothetical protein
MTLPRWFGPALVLLVLTPTTPADEPQSPLAQVPAGSPIVVHLRGLERAKGRLVALVKKALPDLAPAVELGLESALNQGLQGRSLKGMAPDGPIFLAFTEMPKPGEEPDVAVLVRVTNYAAFRDGLLSEEERKQLKRDLAGYDVVPVADQTIYFVERAGYAVVTPKKDVAIRFTKPQPGLDGKLSKELAKGLLEADLAIYVDTAAVNKEYGEQIQQGRQFLELLSQQAAGAGMDKSQMEMVKAVADGLFQGFEDSRSLLTTLDFRPEGLAFHLRVQIAPASMTGQVLKTATPAELQEIATLPAGQMAYVAAQVQPAWVKAMAPMLMGMTAEPDSEQAKAINKALDELAAAGPRLLLQGANLRGLGLTVGSYADPAKAAKAQARLLQSLKEGVRYSSVVLKKVQFQANAQSHRGFELNHVRLTWDLEKTAQGQPGGGDQAVELLKKMMGEGTDLWFGTDGKVYVQVSGKDWAVARKHLDDYLDGKTRVGGQAAFADLRKELPARTTALLVYDVARTVQAMSEVMQAVLQQAGPGKIGPAAGAGQGPPAYFGVALTVQPEQARVDFFIPVAAASEFRKAIEPIIQMFK